MIEIHATRKLFERLPVNENGQFAATLCSQWLYEQPVLDTNLLSGWHANLVVFQRRNCMLLVHDSTRFPLILPALTKPDFVELNYLFADSLMNTLLKCGAAEAQMNVADKYLRSLQVDTQCNRSEQGTLNRMKSEVEHLLWYQRLNVADLCGYRVGAWLADTPRTVKGKGFIRPEREMLELLSGLAKNVGKQK